MRKPMSKLQNRAGTTSPIIPFVFEQANMQATQTDTDTAIAGGLTATYAMPLNGSIVGYAIQLSAAVAAGSLEFDIEVNGATTLTIETDAATTTEFYATIPYGNEPFVAGDKIGVTYTSDGSLSPTTADANIVVFVMFDGFDI